MIRIAIIEDDDALRLNYRLLLGGEPEMEVVGDFGNAEETLRGLDLSTVDILMVDLGLPGMSGNELIRKVKSRMPDLEIMAHTVFDDRENVFSAIKAGASGYILKGSTPRELIEALHTLYAGGAPMSPQIARAVIREFQSDRGEDPYLLSPRERDILRDMERGLTYKEIGSQMHISVHTVHTHIKHIYEKLQAKNRREAFSNARKRGIL